MPKKEYSISKVVPELKVFVAPHAIHITDGSYGGRDDILLDVDEAVALRDIIDNWLSDSHE